MLALQIDNAKSTKIIGYVRAGYDKYQVWIKRRGAIMDPPNFVVLAIKIAEYPFCIESSFSSMSALCQMQTALPSV